MTARSTSLLTLILSLCGMQALAQAPSSPEWAKVLAAAKKEGQVMLYSLQSPGSVDRVVSGFRKAYPEIAVQYLRSSAPRMSARLDRERASAGGDGADVWINSEPAWLRERSKAGQLLKLAGPGASAWPAQFMGENADHAVGGLELAVIAYNKRLVENPPRTLADLIKPEYRSMLGAPEPSSGTIAAWYDWLEKSLGPEFLPNLKAQNPKLFNAAGPMMEALAAGDISIAVYSTPALVKPLVAQGAPLEHLVPEPSAATPLFVAALGWSRRPNAALVLADYFLTREGQVAWHGLGDSASPLPGIPGALPLNNAATLDSSAYSRSELIAYRERWNKLLK